MPNFKLYPKGQTFLLPPSLKDCLPENHICFLIEEAVEQLDLTAIEQTYSEKGCSAYDPEMMLKVMFYSYTQGIRSSRKIEMALYENCAFRYLAANQQPDHGTISLFRKEHLVDLEGIFAQIVLLCGGLGMTDFSDISIDGSKYKAAASKKGTVSKEQIDTLKQKIRGILQQAEQIDREEDKKFGKENPGYNQIPEKLKDKEIRKKEIKRLKKKLDQLNRAEAIIDKKQQRAKTKEEKNLVRNTKVNLTDPSANLMPLKENKSFQPAYNGQLSTSSQVILSYDLTDNADDNHSLIPMIEKTEKTTGQEVEQVKADSAYFSKDNLDEIKNREIDPYIPDPEDAHPESQEQDQAQPSKSTRKSQSSEQHKYKYKGGEFKYNPDKDEFICPQGKPLSLYSISKQGTKRYQGSACSQCSVKTSCTKGKNRSLQFNPQLEKYKQEMRAKLKTKQGKNKYLERFSDVEPVIGNIKNNQGMRQFLCRGKPMALIEFGLCCTAHNLVKIFNWLKKTNNSLQNLQNLQLNVSTRLQAVA